MHSNVIATHLGYTTYSSFLVSCSLKFVFLWPLFPTAMDVMNMMIMPHQVMTGVFCNSAIKAAESDHEMVVQSLVQTRQESLGYRRSGW